MTNQNNAAQAANENPLSDEYVNAIIQRHGYDSPETVIARLAQWIGLSGGENGVTLLMYEAHKALVKLRAPVADERCKRCGGPGWYTNHTTGYPESFPCIACNPQGVSVERLAKDPFLVAQLWRKSAEADGSLLERIMEHVGEYGESMASSTLLSVRTIARRNLETRISAELAALASAPVAGEAQPVAWLHQCRKKPELTQITMKKHEPALAAKGFRPLPLYAAPQASAESVDLPGIDADRLRTIAASGSQTAMTNALLNVARALKQPQADKDGGQQRAGGFGGRGAVSLGYGHRRKRANAPLHCAVPRR